MSNNNQVIKVKSSEEAMLVARDYLKKLDERVFRSLPQPEVGYPPSRFYDVRPAVITSGWAQDANGIWRAQGKFVTQTGDVDNSTVFQIWAPSASIAPATIANETKVFVVWRGRWESLGASAEPTYLQPVRLANAWTLSEGEYSAVCNPIIDGEVDATATLRVYAPTFTSIDVPPGIPGAYKFWAVWRNNRWESLQNVETLGYECVQLASAWTLVSGLWTATASLVTASGTVDAMLTETVYAPTFTSSDVPPGIVGSSRFWVVWRNARWESLQGEAGSKGATLCPMILCESWTLGEDGVYYAQAHPLSETGVGDSSVTVRVYAPASMGRPYGDNQSWKFWAVWRNNRWETIQPNFPPIPNYVAGLGIAIGADDAELGGKPILNTGVRSIAAPNGTALNAESLAETEDVFLNPRQFYWRYNNGDGQYYLYVKTYRLSVVTDIVNGQPVKQTINVIGEE